MTSQSYSKV